jgi:hypothetical protein
MEIHFFLNDDFVNEFHKQIIPHVGEHAKAYAELAQCIAIVDQMVETPYFELCLQQFQAIDPGNSVPSDMLYEELSGFFEMDTELSPYASHLKHLHDMIEKEKSSLIRTLRTEKVTLSSLKKKIQLFHEKKDKLCESTLHQLEFIVEKRRLDKIMTSLPSSVP